MCVLLSVDYTKECPRHFSGFELTDNTKFLLKYFYLIKREDVICNAASSTLFTSKRNFGFAK